MIAGTVEIPTPTGPMDAYVAHPDRSEPAPLVMLFMDIWGLREELFVIARRLADDGYYCLIPNLFHRDGLFSYTPRNPEGRTLSLEALPEEIRASLRAKVSRTGRGTAREDVAAILEFALGEPVRSGPAGVIGFCMGGRFAFFAAQEFPDLIRATASFHGTHLVTDTEDSPHRLVRVMQGELYCGFGSDDPFSPPEAIAAMEEVLRAHRALKYQVEVHPGARHGYALPERDVHHPAATARDWEAIGAMLKRQLAP